MMHGLSTKIGIIGFILVLIIALSTVMINAQSPTGTASPAATATATTTSTGTSTATATATPAIRSFTVDITQVSGGGTPANTADVKLTVKQNNFNLTTQTPTSTATDDNRKQGLIKYCYDMGKASPASTPLPSGVASPSVTTSPGASAAATTIPTATSSSIKAVQGMCVLSADASFTFTGVPMGIHTFSVELVKNDGSSLNPRLYINIELNVVPTSGGGLFGAVK